MAYGEPKTCLSKNKLWEINSLPVTISPNINIVLPAYATRVDCYRLANKK